MTCYANWRRNGLLRTGHGRPSNLRKTWDVEAEVALLREFGRRSFWFFFMYVFGAGVNPKGQRWIDEPIHKPMADWFQKHVDEWMAARAEGHGTQKHLAVLVHREVGKTTMFAQAGQAWLHLLDPDLSSYTGSEKLELAMKIVGGVKSVFEGADPYSLFAKLYGNWAANARTWTAKDVVHSGRKNISKRDPSLGTFGVETSIVGAHPDVIVYDDPISYERMLSDTNWLAAVNAQVTSLFPVIQSDGLVLWVGCVAIGSPVLMANGTWKPIEQVQAGDSVYTTDENGEAAVRRVEASLDQGEADTVIVKTQTSSLRCTPWHPFLVARDGGLSWVRADALKKGDLVASVKRAPSDPAFPWMTPDLAWLCGIIMGDGWIGKNADYACIALSKDDALSERIISVLEDWIPGSQFHRTPFGYLRCNSRDAATAFRALGLTAGAKTKRLPEWIYRDCEEHRVAFLKGMCEADGTVKKGEDSWSVEISNAPLLSDLRLLARTCGVRVGLEGCERVRTIKPPHSRTPIVTHSARSSFNFATAAYIERPYTDGGTKEYRLDVKAAAKLGDNFRLERVVSVAPAGPCHVWDLTVEGSRSFVCNGLVVHNTRYDDNDHFGVAFKEEGVRSLTGLPSDSIEIDPQGAWDVYFMAGRDSEGKPTTPKVWSEERLVRYAKRDPLRYAAQIMNDPGVSEYNPLTKEQIQQCLIDPKDVPWSSLRFGICFDVAFWDGESRVRKDDTVFVVHGYPRNGSGDVYVIEAYGSPLWRFEDFAHRLVATVQRYRRQGRKIIGISDEIPVAGRKDTTRIALQNVFADANEPMPPYFEFSRGGTKKVQRIVNAASFWVDGHVRVLRDAPGVDRLMEQMGKIGQMMVNKRAKSDWADAHSDAFQSEFYGSGMRRLGPQKAPYERGAHAFDVEGLDQDQFDDSDYGTWMRENPRVPIR